MIHSERDRVKEEYKDIGMGGERWSYREMEKDRDLGMEGQRDCGMERQRNGERQGLRDGGTEGLWDGATEEWRNTGT